MSHTDGSSSFKRRRHRRVDVSASYNCAVCGERANCYNFGIPACEGCKAFFRRHMNSVNALVCRKQNNCDVSSSTRKQCASCRMRQCVQAGMRKDPLTKDPSIKKQKLDSEADRPHAVVPQVGVMIPQYALGVMDNTLSDSSSPRDIRAACESSPCSIAYSTNSAFSLRRTTQSGSSVPPKKRLIAVTSTTNDLGSPVKSVEATSWDSIDTPTALGGATPESSSSFSGVTAGLFGSSEADFISHLAVVADDDLSESAEFELSSAAYEQIHQNCMELATSMCAPWRLDELGVTLFDDPMIEDPRYQTLYMEARFKRAVRSLKRARCFVPFSDSERLLLLKFSLLSAMTPLTGYSSVINSTVREHTMADTLEDGRSVVRHWSLYVASFDRINLDLRPTLSRMFNFNLTLKSAFFNDWPVIYSVIVMLTLFPKEPVEGSIFNQYSGMDTEFLAKCNTVRREHLAFLRQYTRYLCEQKPNQVRFDILAAAGGSGAESAWRFCADRLRDVQEIGLMLQVLAVHYCANQPEMSAQILPVIHELMNRLVVC